MRYTTHRTGGYLQEYFPPGVKWLLIINVVIYVLGFLGGLFFPQDVFEAFGLVPADVVFWGQVWQVVTYMFLHGSVLHLVLNMLGLWFFGPVLERDWGTRRFLQYYFLCGVGAALCVIGVAFLVHWYRGPSEALLRTIGASGAIYGVLLAYGVLYPDAQVLYQFLFPIKAKYFVLIVGAVAFFSSFSPGRGISHTAHLGGMIFGYVFLKARYRRLSLFGPLLQKVQKWRMRRAQHRFQVHMRRDKSDRDRWLQ